MSSGAENSDPAAVRGEVQAALADLVVLGEALDLPGGDLHEEEVGVEARPGDVALVPLRRSRR